MIARSARRTSITAALLAVAVLAWTTGAAAQQHAPRRTQVANASELAAQAKAERPVPAAHQRDFGIPPWTSVHPNGKVGQNFTVRTFAAKPKVSIHLPPVSTIVHLYLCFTFGTAQICPDPTADKKVLDGYPDLGSLGLAVGYGPAWLQSGKHTSQPFGELAGVHVAALAFGSIPVTATLHISQPMGRKYISPLQLKFAASTSGTTKGTVIKGFPYGPAPYKGTSIAYFPSHIDGSITVRLSDVRVDQVPVDVGPSCSATRSALHLTSPPGWGDQSTPPQRGKPGEYQGLGNTTFGYLQGTADVGSFTGCHNGAEDLDPLLTSFISSSGNPVDVDVTSGLINWCTLGVGSIDCAPYDDTSPAQTARSAISSTAGIPRSVLRTLPAPIARALTGRESTTSTASGRHATH